MIHLSGITLRPVQEGDLPQVVNLDRLAFSPLTSNAEVEREWYGGTLDLPGRQLFLAVHDQTGLGVGSYAQLDLGIWLQGQEVPAMGIAAVAVAPQRRGQRLAQLMLEHALDQARSQQIPLIMLYPFQHGFYRKLGWAWVGRVHQYRVSTRHLPTYPEREGILPYNPWQQQALQALYNRVAPQHNGWLHRRSWQWESRLKPTNGREVYCYVEAGQLLGYVMLQFTFLEPPKNLLAVVVQEWVALNQKAYRGLVGFLASLRDQVTTIIWNTDAGDPFPYLLKEQRQDPALSAPAFNFGLVHPFGAIGGGFMWRLVDLQRALALRSIPPVEPFALSFRITDPIFGEQQMTAEFVDGRIHCSDRVQSSIVSTSVEHLTEIFCGFRRITDMLWTGEVEFEGDQRLLKKLDAAWQTPAPFCWDFF